jgi:hypothetical protein
MPFFRAVRTVAKPSAANIFAEWLRRLDAALIVANTAGSLMFEDSQDMSFKLRRISDLTGVSPQPAVPAGVAGHRDDLVGPNKLTRVGRSSSTRVVQLTTNTGHMEMIRDDRFG